MTPDYHTRFRERFESYFLEGTIQKVLTFIEEVVAEAEKSAMLRATAYQKREQANERTTLIKVVKPLLTDAYMLSTKSTLMEHGGWTVGDRRKEEYADSLADKALDAVLAHLRTGEETGKECCARCWSASFVSCTNPRCETCHTEKGGSSFSGANIELPEDKKFAHTKIKAEASTDQHWELGGSPSFSGRECEEEECVREEGHTGFHYNPAQDCTGCYKTRKHGFDPEKWHTCGKELSKSSRTAIEALLDDMDLWVNATLSHYSIDRPIPPHVLRKEWEELLPKFCAEYLPTPSSKSTQNPEETETFPQSREQDSIREETTKIPNPAYEMYQAYLKDTAQEEDGIREGTVRDGSRLVSECCDSCVMIDDLSGDGIGGQTHEYCGNKNCPCHSQEIIQPITPPHFQSHSPREEDKHRPECPNSTANLEYKIAFCDCAAPTEEQPNK